MSDKRFFTSKEITITELARLCNSKLKEEGKESLNINGCASLKGAKENEVSFFEVGKYIQNFLSKIKVDLDDTKASAVFVKESDLQYLPENVVALITETPRQSFINALDYFYQEEVKYFISPSAKISATVKFKDKSKVFIGENVVIEDNVEIGSPFFCDHNAVIKKGCVIGDNVKIESNVVISNAIIGSNCVFHRLCQIGAAGFGYESTASGHKFIKQIGMVVIEDEVEIGASSCVDRGALDDTFIGKGTKIDDLVMIGHGCRLGKYCFLCGQVGLAGQTILGDYVICAGQAGLGGHVKIGDFAQIGAQAGVMSDVESGKKMLGTPAMPAKDFLRITVLMRQFIKGDK